MPPKIFMMLMIAMSSCSIIRICISK